MTEETKSKKKEEEEEEQRLRERLKAKQESRRRQHENSEENPEDNGRTTRNDRENENYNKDYEDDHHTNKDRESEHHSKEREKDQRGKDRENDRNKDRDNSHHGRDRENDRNKDLSSSSGSSSRDGRSSSDHGNADLTTQQKRRSRRRRRERRRQHREERREGLPPPPRFYQDYGPPLPPPPPPGPHGYRGGPDGPRWERNGPMPPMRGYHPPPFPPPPHHHGHPGDWGPRGPPPPGWRGPLPPPHHHYARDEYGRLPRFRGRSRSMSSGSRSRSRTVSPSRSPRSRDSSVSRSPSRSPSRGSSTKRSRNDEEGDRRRQPKRRRHHHRHSRRRSPSYSSSSDSGSASSSSSDESDSEDKKSEGDINANALTKDQRTVFVTQLVMRTTEKELRKFFKRKLNCKVMDVELLRDKRTGRHKGSAYVELGRLEDVGRALQASGQVPDFQRFPILVKGSEAEKNYIIPASSATLTASMVLGSAAVDTSPLLGPNGKLLEAQKVYVGNLDPRVSQEHLYALFSQFGSLLKVSMQLDPETRLSRGFCFLSFRDPKEANLAIQTMSNQMLAGRPLKTGWASQASSIPGVEIVTSDEFPDDAPTRIQNAHLVLSKFTGGTTSVAANIPAVLTTAEAAINAAMGAPRDANNTMTSAVPTVAEARANATAHNGLILATAAGPEDDPKVIGNADNPTPHLLIRNMFDKDEETEENWEEDIRLDFEEECTKYGKLSKVVVMSKEPGGKIYASFESVQGAQTCARNLAGRWFDKRQLRVEFCLEDDVPKQ